MRGIDTAARREALSIRFDCALSRSDRLRARSEIPGSIANGRTDERTYGSITSGARFVRNHHKWGPRHETVRGPRPRGGPRYPRYVSTPARSWRESHVVPRDPFDKVRLYKTITRVRRMNGRRSAWRRRRRRRRPKWFPAFFDL